MVSIFTIALPVLPLRAQAQTPAHPSPPRDTLTLANARSIARRSSPELAAARAAYIGAGARARQARAFENPTLSYQLEQTSAPGLSSAQRIVSLDQPLELGGQRGARAAGARLRHEAAEAQLRAATLTLDFDVTSAYALAVAAERRAVLSLAAASAFRRAGTVSGSRLTAGDISGYAHRRIQLEAARYAGLAAEAALARRTARLTLASLIASAPESLGILQPTSDDEPLVTAWALTADSLRALAAVHHAELRVAMLEAQAAAADARLASRERVPVPVLSGGLKNERLPEGGTLTGLVAGVALPLPLWNRRGGAVEAASADAQRRTADVASLRRRVDREVAEAAEALRTVGEQLALLAPQLGAEASKAMHAAEVAYAEGEITLVEWLDAVRAYHEAEATLVSLRAEFTMRRAALERAVGVTLSGDRS